MFKYAMFCRKCLIDDFFFVGGGSWIPDHCPKCEGIETVLWKDLWPWQKWKAARLYKKMCHADPQQQKEDTAMASIDGRKTLLIGSKPKAQSDPKKGTQC